MTFRNIENVNRFVLESRELCTCDCHNLYIHRYIIRIEDIFNVDPSQSSDYICGSDFYNICHS